jgi:hypothetical protein
MEDRANPRCTRVSIIDKKLKQAMTRLSRVDVLFYGSGNPAVRLRRNAAGVLSMYY